MRTDQSSIIGPRAIASFETARSFGGTTITDQQTFEPDDEDEPTRLERDTLRKIPDQLPYSAFLVAVVELCERFAYYGMSGPFQNYIANKYHDPSGNPGAIGMSASYEFFYGELR
jgi:POT family proton-dependent oligopeptide transporter